MHFSFKAIPFITTATLPIMGSTPIIVIIQGVWGQWRATLVPGPLIAVVVEYIGKQFKNMAQFQLDVDDVILNKSPLTIWSRFETNTVNKLNVPTLTDINLSIIEYKLEQSVKFKGKLIESYYRPLSEICVEKKGASCDRPCPRETIQPCLSNVIFTTHVKKSKVISPWSRDYDPNPVTGCCRFEICPQPTGCRSTPPVPETRSLNKLLGRAKGLVLHQLDESSFNISRNINEIKSFLEGPVDALSLIKLNRTQQTGQLMELNEFTTNLDAAEKRTKSLLDLVRKIDVPSQYPKQAVFDLSYIRALFTDIDPNLSVGDLLIAFSGYMDQTLIARRELNNSLLFQLNSETDQLLITRSKRQHELADIQALQAAQTNASTGELHAHNNVITCEKELTSHLESISNLDSEYKKIGEQFNHTKSVAQQYENSPDLDLRIYNMQQQGHDMELKLTNMRSNVAHYERQLEEAKSEELAANQKLGEQETLLKDAMRRREWSAATELEVENSIAKLNRALEKQKQDDKLIASLNEHVKLLQKTFTEYEIAQREYTIGYANYHNQYKMLQQIKLPNSTETRRGINSLAANMNMRESRLPPAVTRVYNHETLLGKLLSRINSFKDRIDGFLKRYNYTVHMHNELVSNQAAVNESYQQLQIDIAKFTLENTPNVGPCISVNPSVGINQVRNMLQSYCNAYQSYTQNETTLHEEDLELFNRYVKLKGQHQFSKNEQTVINVEIDSLNTLWAQINSSFPTIIQAIKASLLELAQLELDLMQMKDALNNAHQTLATIGYKIENLIATMRPLIPSSMEINELKLMPRHIIDPPINIKQEVKQEAADDNDMPPVSENNQGYIGGGGYGDSDVEMLEAMTKPAVGRYPRV